MSHDLSGDRDADGDPVVRADAVPDPMVSYAVQGEDAVVRHTNDAFDSVFGAVGTGQSLQEWWATSEIDAPDTSSEEFRATLVEGDRFDTEATYPAESGERTFRVRSIAGSGGPLRHLLLTPLDGRTDDAIEAERIASVASHDLRNPLDVAKARLQAARETGEEEHFRHLERAHERMERIIRDVLTLARGESAIRISPGVAVGSVAREAWSTVDTGDASLDVDPDLPAVGADRDRLQRLFENLFRNSVEHGRADAQGDDGASLRVWIGQFEDGFYVADDGPGIPEQCRDDVFEPGYTSRDGGTGLGLTIVERIASAHGWTVSATGSADGGTRFEFHGAWTGDA